MRRNAEQPHPRFDRPPVTEVALGAQFKPVAGLGVPQLGLLWGAFRNQFPRVEHHPPLPHEIERRGVRVQQSPFQIQLVEGAGGAIPRLWMINADNTELLQVQQDRFVRNWRRRGASEALYPEYVEHLRPSLIEDLERFARFVRDEGLGSLEFDQCEITYVNHIDGEGVWKGHSEFAKVFRGLSPEYDLGPRCPLDAIGFRARHELFDAAGEFVGRLHIQLDSAFKPPSAEKPEPAPMFALQLIARGRPLGADVPGVLAFLDFGHDAIVTTFDNITSDAMHRAWGRQV